MRRDLLGSVLGSVASFNAAGALRLGASNSQIGLLSSVHALLAALYIGSYTTVMNTGAFLAPLVGVAVVNRIGLAPTLIACGVFGMLGALTFRPWSSPMLDVER